MGEHPGRLWDQWHVVVGWVTEPVSRIDYVRHYNVWAANKGKKMRYP